MAIDYSYHFCAGLRDSAYSNDTLILQLLARDLL